MMPPDVLAAALAYLDEKLPGVKVGTRRPSDAEWAEGVGSLVRVGLPSAGNIRSLVLSTPLLSVECWAPDSVKAFTLAALCTGWLNAWSGRWAGVLIYGCECTDPRDVPDPLTDYPRWLATATVTARRQPIT